jgi:FlaA1/EpsC-like NDP-sugar epimerase
MIGQEDALYTYEYSDYFKILPVINNWSEDPNRIKNGVKVKDDFQYSSDSNLDWMSTDELKDWIDQSMGQVKSE